MDAVEHAKLHLDWESRGEEIGSTLGRNEDMRVVVISSAWTHGLLDSGEVVEPVLLHFLLNCCRGVATEEVEGAAVVRGVHQVGGEAVSLEVGGSGWAE